MASLATILEVPTFRNWRRERWPARGIDRWILRLALAVPFVVVGALAAAHGVPAPANSFLYHQGSLVHWGSRQLGWMAYAYPPLPVGVAAVVRSPTALGVVGGLFAGIAVQISLERLVLRSYRLPAASLFVAAVVGTPIFWYVATQDFAAFLSLVLLSIALTGLLDFVFNQSTESGFIAGLSFGAATLCDPAAGIIALTAGLAALLMGRHRPHQPARNRATLLVVLFPTLAGMAGWVFLEWRFTGSWSASLTYAYPGIGQFPGGVLYALGQAVRTAAIDAARTPLLLVSAIVLVRRRPRSALAALLPVLTIVVIRWIGVPFSWPEALVLLGLLSLTAMPERPSRGEWIVLGLAGAAQFALAIGLSVEPGTVNTWLTSLA
jgi:hypothetical protein